MMNEAKKAEARAALLPIVAALRDWNNKYNITDEENDLFLSACMIDKPETGEKYFNMFNVNHFDFTFRD